MIEWQRRGWAGSDGVHFTRKGAEIAGQKLTEWLLERPATPTTATADSLTNKEVGSGVVRENALQPHSDSAQDATELEQDATELE